MKAILTVAVVALAAVLAVADEPPVAVPPSSTPTASPAPATPPEPVAVPPSFPAVPLVPAAPAAEVPVVRIPVAPSGETGNGSPGAPGETVAEAGSSTTTSAATGAGDLQLGWQSDGVRLRQPGMAGSMSNLRTNRAFEPKGVVPRLVRPERKGFGGFVAGFANLFNPFAPTRQGIATGEGHWYDGQRNVAPLPRGSRDERTHEPSTALFSMDLDADLDEPAATPAPAKAAKTAK